MSGAVPCLVGYLLAGALVQQMAAAEERWPDRVVVALLWPVILVAGVAR